MAGKRSKKTWSNIVQRDFSPSQRPTSYWQVHVHEPRASWNVEGTLFGTPQSTPKVNILEYFWSTCQEAKWKCSIPSSPQAKYFYESLLLGHQSADRKRMLNITLSWSHLIWASSGQNWMTASSSFHLFWYFKSYEFCNTCASLQWQHGDTIKEMPATMHRKRHTNM